MWKEFLSYFSFYTRQSKNHNFQKYFKIFKDVEWILLYCRNGSYITHNYRMSIFNFLNVGGNLLYFRKRNTHAHKYRMSDARRGDYNTWGDEVCVDNGLCLVWVCTNPSTKLVGGLVKVMGDPITNIGTTSPQIL